MVVKVILIVDIGCSWNLVVVEFKRFLWVDSCKIGRDFRLVFVDNGWEKISNNKNW